MSQEITTQEAMPQDAMFQENLTHRFLIAMPQLQDEHFRGSLVYICRHNEEGTLGIVTNLPMDIPLFGVLEQLELEDARPYPAQQTVIAGGPVESNKGFILHDGDQEWESTVALEEGLKLTTSRDIMADIAGNTGPAHYLVALGCAGWGPGQLEQEIMNNAWLVCPAEKDILFAEDPHKMAALATASLGFDMVQLTPTAGYC